MKWITSYDIDKLEEFTVIFYVSFSGLLNTFKEIMSCCFRWYSLCGITWDSVNFVLCKKLIWYSVTFLTFKKELLDSCGYFLIPFLYRDVTFAVFNLSGKMPPSNKALCFSIRVSFIHSIGSLRTKFGTFINTNWKFLFKLPVIFPILSSNTGPNNLKLMFPYIFLSLTVPFVCVTYTVFIRCVILLVTQLISVLLIFQFIYFLPLCFYFIASL